jgi:hypothetical protein
LVATLAQFAQNLDTGAAAGGIRLVEQTEQVIETCE